MGWTRYFRRSRRDDEVAREIASYIEIETDENIARGMSPAAAHAAARRRFGNAARVREEIYRMNTIGFVDACWRDLQFAVRLLSRDKGFAAAAVVSLALGIGANAAIFQLLDAVRLRTLPVERPEELAEVRWPPRTSRSGEFNGRRPMLTNPLFEELRRQQDAFTDLVAWGARTFNTAPGGEIERVEGLSVSGSFFRTLGVGALLGRAISSDDDRRGCPAIAVISHAYWQRTFGADPSAVGRQIRLEGHPFDIVGIMPARFTGVEVGRRFDVAVPICADAFVSPNGGRLDRRSAWWLAAFGRLKPDWNVERATAHLAAISPGVLEATLPPDYQPAAAARYLEIPLIATPAATGVSGIRATFGEPLALLLAVTGLVLIIACANLANLLLARASARSREIAVRLAIGASRFRLVRQLLVESLLLAAMGALAGAALAYGLSRTLVTVMASSDAGLFVDLTWNARIFGFTAGMALLACVIFGLAPAVSVTAVAPSAALGGGRGSTTTRKRFFLGRALVVSQVALSLVLLIGALLFLRTLYNVLAVDIGFTAPGLVAADLRHESLAKTGPDAQAVRRNIRDHLAALPDVASLAQADNVPMTGNIWNENVRLDGEDLEWRSANFNRVSEGYFKAIGIPLIEGRDFSDRDSAAGPRVAIVTTAFVKEFVPDGRALGRVVRVQAAPGEPEPAYTVIGVAGDARQAVRDDVQSAIYLASAQDADPGGEVGYVLRSRGRIEAMRTSVARAIAEVNPEIAIEFTVIERSIRDSLVRERLMAALSLAFGLVAGLLAAVGLYGVMSYTVARRGNEFGIRLALGAERRTVLWMVLRETFALVALGVVVGMALGLAATTAARGLLFGLKPTDPATFAGAAAILAATGLLAGYLPARRASKTEPTATLRES